MHWPRVLGLAASAGVSNGHRIGDQRRPMSPMAREALVLTGPFNFLTHSI